MNNYDAKTVKDKLNNYMRLRGEVVHRSRRVTPGPSQPHPVTKDDLEKAIRFLRSLVEATEKVLSKDKV